MKKSEILKEAIEIATTTSLEKLWEEATGASWENNSDDYSEELGLFFKDTDEFVIVKYVTVMTGSGYKKIFEQQNAAIFIGWVGEWRLINSSVSEMLGERISELELDELQHQHDLDSKMKLEAKKEGS